MSYKMWKNIFNNLKAPNKKLVARIWNLENEYRINLDINNFKQQLGQKYNAFLATYGNAITAFEEALKALVNETENPKSPWLGKLPAPINNTLPKTMYSHITAISFARYFSTTHINLKMPPARIRFSRTPMTNTLNLPIKRFIWLTFEPDGSFPYTTDPTTLAHDLGLAHYQPTDFVYRYALDVHHKNLWIPTCLDAHLYEAWAPPPSTHNKPWGLTRHLTTGKPMKPELLTDVVDHISSPPPEAEIVSPLGKFESIKFISTDFLVNRP